MCTRITRGLVTQKTKLTEVACSILKSALDRFVKTDEDKSSFLVSCVDLLKMSGVWPLAFFFLLLFPSSSAAAA